LRCFDESGDLQKELATRPSLWSNDLQEGSLSPPHQEAQLGKSVNLSMGHLGASIKGEIILKMGIESIKDPLYYIIYPSIILYNNI
jgi:hypothetical protein